jgi:hypothetical protein
VASVAPKPAVEPARVVTDLLEITTLLMSVAHETYSVAESGEIANPDGPCSAALVPTPSVYSEEPEPTNSSAAMDVTRIRFT